MSLRTTLLAAVAATALALPALAVPIAAGSSINIDGGDTGTPTSVTVDMATALTFQSVQTGPQSGTVGATGSFAGLFPNSTPGTITGSTLNLVVGAQPISPFYSFTSGGNMLTFNLTSITNISRLAASGASPANLTVQAAGIINLTGFDATLGGISISTNGRGVTTFAATTIAGTNPPTRVPEPVSIALVGTGLVGLGLIRRRRKA